MPVSEIKMKTGEVEENIFYQNIILPLLTKIQKPYGAQRQKMWLSHSLVSRNISSVFVCGTIFRIAFFIQVGLD